MTQSRFVFVCFDTKPVRSPDADGRGRKETAKRSEEQEAMLIESRQPAPSSGNVIYGQGKGNEVSRTFSQNVGLHQSRTGFNCLLSELNLKTGALCC